MTVLAVARDLPRVELAKLAQFRIWFHDGEGVLVDAADESEATEIAVAAAGRRSSYIVYIESVKEVTRAEGQ